MRRTKMLRARRSRSKWIIIFRTGEDTGQRLRNSVAESFIIDAFFDDLLLSLLISEMIDKLTEKIPTVYFIAK